MKSNKSNGTTEIAQPTEDLQSLKQELETSQKAAADNAELAKNAEIKSSDLQQKLTDAEDRLQANETVILGLKNQLSESYATIAAKNEEMAELKEALVEEKEESGDKKITFDYEGRKYEVLGSVRIPGSDHPNPYTALEIASEESLQAILVSRNSGMIREIK
jgi:chromosome segregation ATPase